MITKYCDEWERDKRGEPIALLQTTERKTLPITLEVENDSSMGERQNVHGREISEVHSGTESNQRNIHI